MLTAAQPQAADWLRFAALAASARRKARLLAHFGQPEALFAAGPKLWTAAGLDAPLQAGLRAAARLDVARDLDRCAELGVGLLVRGQPDFPPLLAAIDDAPALLLVRGRPPALGQPLVAMVGTRRASAYGELLAETLARDLAALGVGIVSGLAAGIDTSAHHGALRGGGYTAAVLGTGVDQVYPKTNAALAERVAAEGGLLSEFPLGTGPRGWHFPLRNRIISGLCRALVVVQAPRDSGALITARLAAEQNREVLAVPGNVTDTRCAGCHALIRDGAILCRDADDVLAAIGLQRLPPAAAAVQLPLPLDSDPAQPALPLDSAPGLPPALRAAPAAAPGPLPALSGPEAAVAAALGLVPLGIDDIIETTGLATPEVQSALVTLELKLVARRLPGNRFLRAT